VGRIGRIDGDGKKERERGALRFGVRETFSAAMLERRKNYRLAVLGKKSKKGRV